jgi:prohibitin 1
VPTTGYTPPTIHVGAGSGASKIVFGGGAALIFALLIMIFSCNAVTTVPAGHVGVLTKFGRVTGEVLGEGLHVIDPLKSVQRMQVRTMELKESASVPSSEGLILTLDTSLLFHLNPSRAADVYQKLGPSYVDNVVEPSLRSATREATASHTANALYSNEREKVSEEIYTSLQNQLGPRGILVEKVLLRDIQLPQTLKASIEQKQQAEQEALAMSFRLQKEEQEAQRKRIEAQGIKDFQTIVSQGISEPLLKWKGIEATEQLARSPNSKIVVIGSGKDGLPVILGKD